MKANNHPLLLAAAVAVALASSGQALTELNFTTFDGTETTSDGNLGGFANPGGGAGYDTVNGWTWGSDWTGATGGPGNGGLFDGLGSIQDQDIRSGPALELEAANGRFNFGFGNSSHQLALAQAFTVTVGDTITVTYNLTNTNGMYLYIDPGSGTYGTRDHDMIAGADQTFSFVTTGTNIRIAVRGNDGADSDGLLTDIKVETSGTIIDDDNDNLPDPWEEQFFPGDLTQLTGLKSGPGSGMDSGDWDGDGVSDLEEHDNDGNPTLANSDSDALSDFDELHGTFNHYKVGHIPGDPAGGTPGAPTKLNNPDSDGDGISDDQEVNGQDDLGADHTFGATNPNDDDTDGDTLLDGFEINDGHGLDPTDDGRVGETNPDDKDGPNGRLGDPDGENLLNWEEQVAGTHPNDADTDDDASDDEDELFTFLTDPLDPDTDDDGFWDGAETNNGVDSFVSYDYGSNTGDTGSDPLEPDTDGDGLLDGVENGSGTFTSATMTGTDPTVADDDGDGMADGYEVDNMLDPNDDGTGGGDPDNGADGDPDGDLVTNIDEHDRGSDPQSGTGTFAAVNVDSVAHSVLDTDLLETSLASIAAANAEATADGVDPATYAAILANGSFDIGTLHEERFLGESSGNDDWVEFHLDTTTNTAGYDITGIQSFCYWNDSGAGGRSAQAYAVEVRPVGGAWTPLLAETVWTAGLDTAGQFTRVSHGHNGAVGTPLATGIGAVRVLLAPATPRERNMYREFDVIGTPAVPVDVIGLKAIGFDGSDDFVLEASLLDPAKSYELKRGTDLMSFGSLVPAVILNGAGGATQMTKDEDPLAGEAYYRLEETP